MTRRAFSTIEDRFHGIWGHIFMLNSYEKLSENEKMICTTYFSLYVKRELGDDFGSDEPAAIMIDETIESRRLELSSLGITEFPSISTFKRSTENQMEIVDFQTRELYDSVLGHHVKRMEALDQNLYDIQKKTEQQRLHILKDDSHKLLAALLYMHILMHLLCDRVDGCQESIGLQIEYEDKHQLAILSAMHIYSQGNKSCEKLPSYVEFLMDKFYKETSVKYKLISDELLRGFELAYDLPFQSHENLIKIII